jgi:hypothetical protein
MKYVDFLGKMPVWLLFYGVVRLVGITHAPLEEGHNWRQSITCAITQNMYEISADLRYPRTQMGGAGTGITPTEFPFFNFLAYLFCRVFGYAHWYGRLINLMVSTAGVWAFWRLLLYFFNKNVAFYACLCLLSSIWFGFSRKIMPDTFSVSLVLMAVYAAYCYLKQGKYWQIAAFFVLATLGVLCKITAVAPLCVVAFFVFSKGTTLPQKLTFVLSGCAMLGIWVWWYGVWSAHLLHTYHTPMYFPTAIGVGAKFILNHLSMCAKRFYFDALMSYVALAMACVGLIKMVINKNKKLLLAMAAVVVVYLVLVCKVGYIFATHNYYIIPVVPVLCVLVGWGVAAIPYRFWRVVVLVALCAEGVLNQYTDFTIKPKYMYKLALEPIMDKISVRSEPVAVVDGSNPQLLLFMHRKGWAIDVAQAQNTVYLQTIKQQGCRWVVVCKDKNSLKLQLNIAFENENICIYGL